MTARSTGPPGHVAAPAAGGGGLDVRYGLSSSSTSTIPPDPAWNRDREGYRRVVLQRRSNGRCLLCQLTWATIGGSAIASATGHTRSTGHPTIGRYEADYCYVAAPPTLLKEPAHADRIRRLLANRQPRSASWLAEALGLRGGAIFRPLTYLLDHGHVDKLREGRRVYYQRTDRGAP